MRQSRIMAGAGVILILVALILMALPAAAQDESSPVGEPPDFLRGIYDAWVGSGHADFEAEAFIHWNEDGEIQESCARCHSTPGYQDFLGADGSEAGVVDAPAPLGTVVNCDACHNSVSISLSAVTFPSGVELTDLGDSARCMVCHQGRAWGGSVDAAVEELGLTEEPNTVSEELRFINIHYYAAAASLFGSEVHGGYEYAGNTYQMRFQHVEEYDTCFECHNPHTLELKVAECATCHEDVESVEDTYEIRMPGSMIDYDGDGDMEEGIKAEIETLQEMLLGTMQVYADEIVGTAIVYDSHSYPYFFADTDGDGAGDDRYVTFTPALLQAAYNYQVSQKDPGAFAHNAKYHIQLLYDSIEALSAQLADPVDLAMANRDSPGHFDSSGEPFRHWDEDGEISGSCTKCHTAEGLPFFLEHGVTIAREPSSSLNCTTCHSEIGGDWAVYTSDEVEMPSGAVISFGEEDPSNICLNCHQGRESSASVQARIARAGVGVDEVSEALGSRNPHYFAAGATLFGSQAAGAYQYDGKEYSGRNEHTRRFDECADCHNQHSLTIRFEECTECHENVETAADVFAIRNPPEDEDPVDFDGDGDTDEPIKDEIAAYQETLYGLMQSYAEGLGAGIVYNGGSYPYWFTDTDGDGEASAEESVRDNSFAMWTPNLVAASYNYLWSVKDPGAFAHNSDYILQTLYDSIEALGGEEAVAGFTRPEVRIPED